MTEEKLKVLVVEDDAVDREALTRLAPDFLELFFAPTGVEAIASYREHQHHCVLLDYRLPDIDGIELISEFNETPVAIIMLTGQGDEHIAVEAMKRGAHDYLVKDTLSGETLARAIQTCVEKVRMLTTIREHEEEKDVLIAELKEALQNIETLSGLIPICAQCKKVRDDKGYWDQVESFITRHSKARFSHGYCPDCAAELLADAESTHEAAEKGSTGENE